MVRTIEHGTSEDASASTTSTAQVWTITDMLLL